jgi:gamma-glutamyl-gamma-aminobutyrate hydrolase PuuD
MFGVQNEILDLERDTDGVYKLLSPTCSSPKGGVYVVGNCFRQGALAMFRRAGYEVVSDIELADIVCWLGGSDINPKLYGEGVHGAHLWDDLQDARDLKALELSEDRFKVGICRGAQLLNCIPNKGSLWQDTDNHGYYHEVTDVITGSVHITNSIHHQQLRLTDKAELIAYATESTKKECEKFKWFKGQTSVIPEEPLADKDVEAAWYPDTKSLLIQWHPEVGGKDSTSYFFNLMDRYYHAA